MISGRTTAALLVALLVGYFLRAGSDNFETIRLIAPLLMAGALIVIGRWLDRGDPVDPWKRAADEQDDP